MRYRLLDLIVCPACGGELRCAATATERVEAAVQDGPSGEVEEIVEGELTCEEGHFYPIINRIPRLLLPELLVASLQQFHPEHYARYQERFQAQGPGEPVLKKKTLRSFSYQWNVFSEMYDHWEENFNSYFQPLVQPQAFAGKRVLDAGCGFGRHAFYAGKYGAEVVAMDLSEAVETACANTRSLARVHVIQADMYHPPLQPCFDLIYCVGVIQHLPDPAGGFNCLARVLAEGASLFVWVYGRRRGLYRLVDLMRRVSTRLPMRPLYGLTYILNLASFLLFSLPYKVLRCLPGGRRLAAAWPFTRYADLPLRVGHADWFDRLSVPSTVYFSRAEVEGWYRDAGLGEVAVQSRDGIGWRAIGRWLSSSRS